MAHDWKHKRKIDGGTVEFMIDWDRLTKEMGKRAAKNRSKRALDVKGAIVAKWHPDKTGGTHGKQTHS